MNAQDLSALINIRAFAVNALNNVLIRMNNEEVKVLRNKIPELDKKILAGVLELNLTHLDTANVKEAVASKKKEKKTVESTEL